MATPNDDIVYGSDETFQHICDLCVEDEKHLEAKAFCSVCHQYMCDSCQRLHARIKATKDHLVVTGNELTTQNQTAVTGNELATQDHTAVTTQAHDDTLHEGGVVNKGGTGQRRDKSIIYTEDFDVGSTGVCAMEVLPCGYLVLCDHNNQQVVLYNSCFEAISSLKLSEQPWGMAMLSPKDFVVSLLKVTSLQNIRLESGYTLKLADKIQTNCPISRILKYKDGMIVLMEDARYYYFCESDNLGRIKRSIRKERKSSGRLKMVYFMALSQDNTVLYVTDLHKGCYGFTMIGGVVFRHRSAELTHYVGVATDTDVVYLSSPEIGELALLDNKGKKIKCMPMTEGFKPGLMAYDLVNMRLFIKEYLGSRIRVLNLAVC